MIRIRSANSENTANSRYFYLDLFPVNLLNCLFPMVFRKFSPGTLVVVTAFWFLVAGFSGSVVADDWAQINGPTRNGVVSDTLLFSDWDSKKLQTAWSREIGQGNSGPVVVGDKLYIFHRPGKSYLLEALNKNTGALLWQRELPAGYTGGVDGDLGPKSVPVVSQGKIFLLGTEGNLFCVDIESGELRWQK
ncbi:MAG: PQQ-binding-like beta-propeller repeat protein, partial [Planctomycetaceae bacterium]|nr:PQQ-binding-like beta-propeller repeat protein [Planctomycetaceae bacterium]